MKLVLLAINGSLKQAQSFMLEQNHTITHQVLLMVELTYFTRDALYMFGVGIR